MRRETKIILIIFSLAFLLRIISSFLNPVLWWDETVYANLGYDLSHNFLDYSLKNGQWSDFIPSGGDSFYAWPKIGFRAPLLSYSLSLIYLINLNFLIKFFVPLIGALSVIIIYLLGKKLFNKRVGIYSALFLALFPLHVYYSGKILTGVFFTFFVLLTFLSFWKGYEEDNKKHKILFGIFLALSLLARYTALWIMPIFLIYFLVRDKSFKFLKDKYLWYSILAFFITLIPLFIYGMFEYNSPIGALIHGGKASAYWGGMQSWSFFFQYAWQIFSIIGLVFLFSLGYILYKKEFLRKEIYLLLIWIIFFLSMALFMPHKEDRFILPIFPAICLLSGFFMTKLENHRKKILIFIVAILLISISLQFIIEYKRSYTGNNECFLDANEFLKDIEENILIISDESAIVYYYTKYQTRFYPNPFSLENIQNSVKSTDDENRTYILFTEYDMPLNEKKNVEIKRILDDNFKKVFECLKQEKLSIVYRY